MVSETETSHIVYSKTFKNSTYIYIPLCSDLLNSKGFEPIEVPHQNSGSETILFPAETNFGSFVATNLEPTVRNTFL